MWLPASKCGKCVVKGRVAQSPPSSGLVQERGCPCLVTVSWPSSRCGLTAWAPLSRVAWTSTRPPCQLPPHFALLLLAARPLGSFVINVRLQNPLDQLPHFGFSSHRILNNLFELLSPLSKCDRFSQHIVGFVTSRFRAHAFAVNQRTRGFVFNRLSLPSN